MKRLAHATLLALLLAAGPVFAHGAAASHGAAIGKPGKPAKVSRTIRVEMNDTMRFVPSTITVRRGDTVRLLVSNSGRMKHELVLGSAAELMAHATLMRRFPTMQHADPTQLAVEPGQSGELIWQFTRAGKVDFACLQPGHFEAGMRGRVAVR